jgi:hypothetical protein
MNPNASRPVSKPGVICRCIFPTNRIEFARQLPKTLAIRIVPQRPALATTDAAADDIGNEPFTIPVELASWRRFAARARRGRGPSLGFA